MARFPKKCPTYRNPSWTKQETRKKKKKKKREKKILRAAHENCYKSITNILQKYHKRITKVLQKVKKKKQKEKKYFYVLFIHKKHKYIKNYNKSITKVADKFYNMLL